MIMHMLAVSDRRFLLHQLTPNYIICLGSAKASIPSLLAATRSAQPSPLREMTSAVHQRYHQRLKGLEPIIGEFCLILIIQPDLHQRIQAEAEAEAGGSGEDDAQEADYLQSSASPSAIGD